MIEAAATNTATAGEANEVKSNRENSMSATDNPTEVFSTVTLSGVFSTASLDRSDNSFGVGPADSSIRRRSSPFFQEASTTAPLKNSRSILSKAKHDELSLTFKLRFDKLGFHGREKEKQVLCEALDRASSATRTSSRELILIKGESG